MKKYKCAISKVVLFGLMLFPVWVFAETFSDSLGTAGRQVASWLQSFGIDHATEIVSALSLVIGWACTRIFTFVVKRKTKTWYWNEKTQKFAVNWIFKLLSGLFGKRVLYYNPRFEGPTEITDEQKKKIIKEYLQQHSKEIKVEVK